MNTLVRNRWTVQIGGAGRSGAGLSGLISRVYLYMDDTDGKEGLGCEWLGGLVCFISNECQR